MKNEKKEKKKGDNNNPLKAFILNLRRKLGRKIRVRYEGRAEQIRAKDRRCYASLQMCILRCKWNDVIVLTICRVLTCKEHLIRLWRLWRNNLIAGAGESLCLQVGLSAYLSVCLTVCLKQKPLAQMISMSPLCPFGATVLFLTFHWL